MWFILDRYLWLLGLSPAILRICNVLYYPTSIFFVTNKANCFVCSSQQSWRAAGCCFLDNDLYVLSCEHTFPISCCRFSSLGKLNSCSYIVFSKVFFPQVFSPVFFQVSSHHLSHPQTKAMVEFESQQHRAGWSNPGALTVLQPCTRLALSQVTSSR